MSRLGPYLDALHVHDGKNDQCIVYADRVKVVVTDGRFEFESIRGSICGMLTKLIASKFKGDPSVQQAVSQETTDLNEDFNPFERNARSAPPVSLAQPTSGTIPARTAVPVMSNDELFRRQEELERKAQELRRREQELERQQRTGDGRSASSRTTRPHNWPPLPSCIPLQPCFYQDIEVEIPVQFQHTVTLVYYVFLTYVLALTVNVVASFFYVIFGSGPVGILVLAIIQILLLSSCSFLFWFRPVYKAFRNDSSFSFMLFFIVLFFHSIFTLVQALGLSQYACGWINAINTFHHSIFTSFIMIISAIAFTASFVGMVFALFRVHRFYRGAGFSLDKARKEFSDGVMADRNVQKAVSEAARAATSAATTQAMNHATQSGRY
ncbi:Secretory carrier-associated membrane protein 4 [Dirofilaria immitis]|nr:Secretory carrier-associated membrane protein 4 [Dirofilaria immitis]